MNFLRAFVRGLARTVMRGLARQAVRGAITRTGGGVRTMVQTITRQSDDAVEDMSSMLDVMDLLELAAEADSIIDNARMAATEGSLMVFDSQYQSYNPGQKALVDQYVRDYVEEYWQTTSDPDPNDFLGGLYSTHEAIEQALSDSCEQSYESGRQSGVAQAYQDLSAFIGEEMLSRGFDMSDVRSARDNFADFSAEIHQEFRHMEEVFASGNIPPHLRMRYVNGRVESMVIADNVPGVAGATRQLSWGQFMGSNQPYWFTESNRMLGAKIQGHLSDAQYESYKADLYAKTYDNPWSTSAPAGYQPYNGPTFQARN